MYYGGNRMENGKSEENEEKGDFQASEILLEIARFKYQNEFNRTSVVRQNSSPGEEPNPILN